MIMTMEFPSPLHVLASLFIETDLMHHWVEGFKADGDDNNLIMYKNPTQLISAMHMEMDIPTQGSYHFDITSTTYLDRKTAIRNRTKYIRINSYVFAPQTPKPQTPCSQNMY